MNNFLIALVVFAVAATNAGVAASAPSQSEWQGLPKVKIKGFDAAYVRSGLDLAKYSKLMLDPVEVTFSKNWNPNRTSSRLKVGKPDQERIGKQLASLADDSISQIVGRDRGQQRVAAAGADVMRITASLTEVYVNLPEHQVSEVPTFARNAGRMTLMTDLRDSETGVLLAHFVDEREAREDGAFLSSNDVQNSAALRRLLNDLAGDLRSYLDTVLTQETKPR